MGGGAREEEACKVLGLDARTAQRWRSQEVSEDKRMGPKQRPKNALTPEERAKVLFAANCAEHRDLSPNQIVPRLADKGIYIASESTFYRVLHEAKQVAHRGRAKPAQKRETPEHVATGANQVWVWDITYLPTTTRGSFFFLYLMLDLFSRKVVGWAVYEFESMELSAELLGTAMKAEGVAASSALVLHADNGGPMKGSTMLAKMQQLGVVPSFSRPSVSDDNAYAESFFRHLKYAPAWPAKPFATIEEARSWVARFVDWYNTQHRHSGIRYVTPLERHEGREHEVLQGRERLYEEARRRHPERWSGSTRNWKPVEEVALTPASCSERAAGKTSRLKAGVQSPCQRRRLPVTRTTAPQRAQEGSRTAQPAREASESLTRPSTMGRSRLGRASSSVSQREGASV